jgi:YtkA-like
MRACIFCLLAMVFGAPAASAAALGPARSADGRFRLTLESRINPLVINRIHDWTIALTDADGAPVDGARIGVGAGVPGLGRIMPTAPRVVGEIGPGLYLLEGVKFDMAGRWRLNLDIDAGAARDRVSFDIEIK